MNTNYTKPQHTITCISKYNSWYTYANDDPKKVGGTLHQNGSCFVYKIVLVSMEWNCPLETTLKILEISFINYTTYSLILNVYISFLDARIARFKWYQSILPQVYVENICCSSKKDKAKNHIGKLNHPVWEGVWGIPRPCFSIWTHGQCPHVIRVLACHFDGRKHRFAKII